MRKHALDIKYSKCLVNSDLICLTETHLLQSDDTTGIEQTLSDFHIEHNCSNVCKFRSLAFCLNKNVLVMEHEKFEGVSILTVRKLGFVNVNIKIALIYRQPNSQL